MLNLIGEILQWAAIFIIAVEIRLFSNKPKRGSDMARKRKSKKKKWGKVGAPGSAKRRNWMQRMRSARKGKVLKRSVSGNHAARKKRKKRKKSVSKRVLKRKKTRKFLRTPF